MLGRRGVSDRGLDDGWLRSRDMSRGSVDRSGGVLRGCGVDRGKHGLDLRGVDRGRSVGRSTVRRA